MEAAEQRPQRGAGPERASSASGLLTILLPKGFFSRLALCAVLAVAAAGAVIAARLYLPVDIDRLVELDVAPGTPMARVAGELEHEGAIRDAWAFALLARLSGSDRRIHYGRHFFGGRMNATAVLAELSSPPRPTHRVTIPEGATLAETAAILESEGLASADEYLAAACDEELRELAGAAETANCTEGFLFPDTYRLRPGMSAPEIVRMQLARFNAVLDDLLTELGDPASLSAPGQVVAARKRSLEPEERQRLVTLASVIEKEASDRAEQPLISAVFRNRLERGMKLQADPTIIYGLMLEDRWDGNITRAHLREATPYNTYAIDGLPPGPICNPGRHALEAALNPADSDYLYFVAQGDGSHTFSRTLAEHTRAVRKHQLKR